MSFKKLGGIALSLILANSVPAFADTTAAQVIPGTYQNPGSGTCPSSAITPCFVPISNANPLPVTLVAGGGPVTTAPIAVTPTDRGGTITVGGTAQTLAASNTSRKVLVVVNPCTATGQGIATAEDLFISVTGNATVNGAGNFADLATCGSASISWNGTVFTSAVTVNAATTGHRWSATEGQ